MKQISVQTPCMLEGGCVKTDACGEFCEATPEDVEKLGLSISRELSGGCYQKIRCQSAGFCMTAARTIGALDLDHCRAVIRHAADCYRIITELGGAKHLKTVALNQCVAIMDICEMVAGEMDGRPDKS